MQDNVRFGALSIGDVLPAALRANLFGAPSAKAWFVLLVAPRSEIAVTAQLERLGAEACWFPTETGWRTRRGQRRKERYLRRVAPGYLFMQTGRQVAWHLMAEMTHGRVRGVLGHDGAPLCVKDVARLDRIRTTPKLLEGEGLRPGCDVELKSGPLAGFVFEIAAIEAGIATLFSPAFHASMVRAEVDALERLA